MPAQTLKPEEYRTTEEPCYGAVANEVDIFKTAYRNRLAISLRGPTCCVNVRLLIHVGKLMVSGISPLDACASSVSQALTDDRETLAAVNEFCASVF